MYVLVFILIGFLVPRAAFAVTTVQNILCTLGSIIGQLTPIVAGLALLAFFWGLVMYLFSLSGSGGAAAHMGGGGYGHGMAAAATPEGKRTGRSLMLYGIIVLFVMVSVWGLVNILQETFDIQEGGIVTPPKITNEPITPPVIRGCGT